MSPAGEEPAVAVQIDKSPGGMKAGAKLHAGLATTAVDHCEASDLRMPAVNLP